MPTFHCRQPDSDLVARLRFLFVRPCAARSSAKNAVMGCLWPVWWRAELDGPVASSSTCSMGCLACGAIRHPAWGCTATATMREQLVAPYVFLLETDHVFMRPLPNLATPARPVAWRANRSAP